MNRLPHILAFATFLLVLPITSIADTKVSAYFNEKLKTINRFLADNHKKAVQEPSLLTDFVDNELLEVWSAKNTVRALLGPRRWKQLSHEQAETVIAAYEDTIRRYLFETVQKYSNQTASVESLRLNSKGNKGLLRVVVESPSLPDFNVDLKIYKDESFWTVYDFSFQGVSFVSLKRNFFRSTFDSFGIEGVVNQLNKKNQAFERWQASNNNE